MDDRFKILDTRNIGEFKQKTFSGYKKTDVINIVFKSMEENKLENSCNWCIECIVSGYSIELWDKLINFSSKIVHINNPNLPFYILKKNKIFENQLKYLGKDKENILLLRNSQMIRNLFFDVISTLTSSYKKKRYDKIPKLDEKEDFISENINKKLFSQMIILPNHLIHFTDPDDLRTILNEIFTMLKNLQFGYNKCCYWISWLVKWENLHKKHKLSWTLDNRDIKDVNQKYLNDIIWPVWETIFEEVKIRDNANINHQIQSLFKLFRNNYSTGKRNKRLFLVFNAVGYLTHEINFDIPLRNNFKLFIDSQCNVNKMYMEKKQYEVNNPIIKENIKTNTKKSKKPKQHEVEIVQDQISLFNEVDAFIMK